MKTYLNPPRNNWKELLKRPEIDSTALREKVKNILDDIRLNGDKAVQKYSQLFDGAAPENLQVTDLELAAAEDLVSPDLKAAIKLAAANIETFHSQQLEKSQPFETMPGVLCWRKTVAIERVGFYIPGGSAPLFSTILMLGIPARIAGCPEIVLCSPPDKTGQLHPAILYTAGLVGIRKIFKIGGVQAIGAMAYGTARVPVVNKIFGPGNQYVTCAKQLIQLEGVAIDMPAGPSEVCVLADETANPEFIAADLLSQAEHGPDSQVLLVTTVDSLIPRVEIALEQQLELLPRKEIAEQALRNSKLILVENIREGINLVNAYAPEHLIIACKNARALGEQIINAGSVFLGAFSPESAGDYASGTNHTLPTNGFAKAFSGVSVDSFVKKITFQELTREGLGAIGTAVEKMADAEGLQAHARAVSLRLNGK